MTEKKVKVQKEKKKINPMMIMLVLMLLLIAGLGAGLGYLILNQGKATTKVTVVTAPALEIPPLTYPIEKDFTVNLTDTDAKHYVKLNITLAFTSSKLSEELVAADAFIRDTVISVLREKKSTDFTAKGTEELKKEILARINPYLKEGKVSDVYFNDYLVQ